MADDGSIFVTAAAGQFGAVGRTVTDLLFNRGLPDRAVDRREDDRTAALRAACAQAMVGDLLDRPTPIRPSVADRVGRVDFFSRAGVRTVAACSLY
jgi:NAD(P)H dehydrogenase (quinone)